MKIPLRKIRKLCFVIILIIFVTFVLISCYKFFYIKSSNYFTTQKLHYSNKNIPVIVGRFIEPNSRQSFYNLTQEILNENAFEPQPLAGKDGNPVFIPPYESQKMIQLFQVNRFNLLASNRIPLNRSLLDVRKANCKFKYNIYDNLPNTSIIIVFHNEAWSTLLRTIWSVINRSPRHLLHEIILVDDASTRTFLKSPLDLYIKTLPVPTKIVRSVNRIGLIKARLKGANEALGEILTFLDAHCECTIGWLESLLSTLVNNRTKVVSPIIDIISDETFAYIKSFELHWGAFNWRLHFRWLTLDMSMLKKRQIDLTEPFATPVMAGGLFAIDKQYFFRIGAYDDQMQIWGGENLELSLRIWQCGGTIEIVPCSHVGHIFRKSSPYEFPGGKVGDILYENLARVALVWLDEWSNFYFKFNPEADKFRWKTNVTNRVQLRLKLQCNNFQWFLNTVWPQHFFPTKDRFFGRIINIINQKCIFKPISKGTLNQPMGRAMIKQYITMNSNNLNELFVMTKDGFIMTDESICLDAPDDFEEFADVYILACNGYQRQKWKFNQKDKHIIHVSSNYCLDVKTNDLLVLYECSHVKTQQWLLQEIPWS